MVLWRSRHLPCVFKEYLETRNNLEENENLWIQDLHLGDPQVRSKTRGPLVLYRSPEDLLNSAVSEEKKFKHSFRVGGRQPIRAKNLCQQEGLITVVICCKFKKKFLQPLTLYTSFHDLINVYSHRSGVDNPRGQNFDVNRNLLSIRSFATSY